MKWNRLPETKTASMHTKGRSPGMPNQDPVPESESVRRRMQNTRRRDTDLEVIVRSLLHRRGLRYRVDRPIQGVTRGRPDITFPTERVAVFIDGCFWHRCPRHGTDPKNNAEWWRTKLDANVERDRRHDRELVGAGWRVLRYWDHEDAVNIADSVEREVRSRRSTTKTRL